ncbi:class I SAM-dependent methyltransferase [Nisaea acidiphila]|uniref:Class I SAM-dependent methyltransferase n=1 Tax=Nisaea acidiphila TaxID=1862145 RepID=A0A9J7AVS3_9PROT|nr:class I SAM-dependent methyltransferase [Nisaea acidiphila]UUX50561.1 class I SAM-dependent methyltransferase [Nisaea acidiphila]
MHSYSRSNPSPRYLELLALYKTMHAEGFVRDTGNGEVRVAAAEAYPGQQILNHLPRVRELVQKHEAETVLDYGCGKGLQYRSVQLRDKNGKTGSVQDYWGVSEIRLYDPGVPDFSELPAMQSDGVICTDVLEHIPESDLLWVVEELYSQARKFVYAAVACYPAQALLPTGENAHETVRPPSWWRELFSVVGRYHPQVAVFVDCETK